ncbi:ATPase domain-containing protein [Methanobacterium petrolearium]|uniref:ATPase domain-containing protein n=1 Tax=Methanobacterium petrolearium TaxID=710190 RepID=UPI001AEB90BC|nr:ATPase domain-containing protein [Methanobacterium petrolearium]MBP1945240.1 KaiC/GvpD/RAD55 family RecA-like ATPase [Methanobacterium petrolearium]BDZ71179.1 recombinase [Methanobacterium petrolearium]
MERIKTGIEGIDQFTGGIPHGKSVLLTGDAGSGKTIFGLQFALKSSQNNQKTVYITTEEDSNDLFVQGNTFKWNIQSVTESGFLTFIELAGVRARVIEAEININVGSMKGNFSKFLKDLPKDTEVLVIDNIGSYTAQLTPYEFRDRFDLLVYELNKRNITALIILDSATSKEFNEIALFSVYGAIKLMKRENPYTGRRERVMDVVKMRSTKTPTQFITYEIGEDGIQIISGMESKE